MKITAEIIVTLCLFLSRVWSRPSDYICDGGRREGDKWFDGCQWCICHQAGPVCSLSECSFLSAQLPPCHEVGSSWMDGCYMCKCHRSGIECIADHACVLLMRSVRFQTGFQSYGACVEPEDDRCICGIDAVPSCTAEVIDKNAYPAITIELIPTPSSPSFSFQENVLSNSRVNYEKDEYTKEHRPELRTLNKNQFNQHKRHSLELYSHDHRGHSENTELPQTVDPNSLARLQGNSYSLSSTVAGDRERTEPSRRKEPYNSHTLSTDDTGSGPTRLYARNLEDNSGIKYQYIIPTEHNDPGRGIFDTTLKHLNTEPIKNVQKRQFEGNLYRNPYESHRLIQTYRNDGEPVSDTASPSILMVSANRCRWGARWYGGSLRCYCGEDNSITCGDPSFVAPILDGFILKKAPCEEGDTWEEQDSCTVCQCQIRGVILCRRSSSCSLPFLIKPLSNGGYDLRDFDISETNQYSDRHGELTGMQEQTFLWNNTKNETDQKMTSDANPKMKHLSSATVSGITEISTTDNGGDDERESKFILDDVDGSGENTLHITTTSWDKGGDKHTDVFQISSTTGPQVDYTSQKNILVVSDNVDSLKNDKQQNNLANTTQHIYNKDSYAKKENDNKDNNMKGTTQVTTTQCKPLSRWIDGCKHCQCSMDGKKYCDESRCPKAVTSSMETPKQSSGNGDKRPMQRPPSMLFPTRDHPVDLIKMPSTSCGRFQPGDLYWDDCNACLCTQSGPKCTAKNCT